MIVFATAAEEAPSPNVLAQTRSPLAQTSDLPPELLGWLERHLLELLGLLVLLLVIQTLRLVWQQGKNARRMNRGRNLGQKGEAEAKRLLRAEGYQIVKEQIRCSYPYLVDGQASQAQLVADFLVQKGKKSFIAEVKSGEKNSSPKVRATRRQLFEYQWAFDVDGVLLIDMNRRRIVEVCFVELTE